MWAFLVRDYVGLVIADMCGTVCSSGKGFLPNLVTRRVLEGSGITRLDVGSDLRRLVAVFGQESHQIDGGRFVGLEERHIVGECD